MTNNKEFTNKDFGDALKELLEERELSYGQMAVKIGSSATYINDFIKKKLLPPRNEVIEKIAKALSIKPEYFKEYRSRRLAEKLRAVGFNKDDYDVPLSNEEVEYLKKLIEKYSEKK